MNPWTIVAGIGAGILYGAFGYFELRPKDEKFSGPKFVRAVGIGAVAGAGATYYGIPIENAESQVGLLVGTFGLSFIIDQFCIDVWARLNRRYPALPGA